MKRSAAAILAVVMPAFLAAGCNKFTRERYDTIYADQPQVEVRKKLGRPDRTVGSAWVYVNDEPFYNAVIVFRKGKVAEKHWSHTKVLPAGPKGQPKGPRKPPPRQPGPR